MSNTGLDTGLDIDNALSAIGRGHETVYDMEVVEACPKLLGKKGYAIPA